MKVLLLCMLVLMVLNSCEQIKDIRVWFKDADREVFKASQHYNEAQAKQLSKLRLEMIRSKCPVEKKAIAESVNIEFADFNIGQLESEEMRKFLRDCQSLNLSDY